MALCRCYNYAPTRSDGLMCGACWLRVPAKLATNASHAFGTSMWLTVARAAVQAALPMTGAPPAHVIDNRVAPGR